MTVTDKKLDDIIIQNSRPRNHLFYGLALALRESRARERAMASMLQTAGLIIENSQTLMAIPHVRAKYDELVVLLAAHDAAVAKERA